MNIGLKTKHADCRITFTSVTCYDFSEMKRKIIPSYKKVHVGKDQEKAQSEKDSHSKNRSGGKKPN